MTENHPFTIRIEPHIEGSSRYRWSVYEKAKLRDQSLTSHATIRQAHADANKVLQRLIKNWRVGK
jgi:hypothetical protein